MALPLLNDPNFARTVVFVLEHNDEGAFGLVLNRPTDTSLFDGLAAWTPHVATPPVVFAGGPVQPDGFVGLAQIEGDPDGEAWSSIGGGLGTVDLSLPPTELTDQLGLVRVFHGYAGWGPEQLDGELDLDAWLVVDKEPSDLFTDDPDGLWRAVLARQPGRTAWLADYPDDPAVN